MKPTTIARGLVLTILACIFWEGGAYALKYPHNSQKSIACSSCHYAGFYLKVKTKSTPCLDSNCHQPGAAGPTSAKRKALPLQYGSNVFGNFTNGSVGKKPVSHAWSVNQINPSAGATKQLTPIGNKASTFAANINCSRCHLTHGTTLSGYPQSFLRHDKRGDGICLSCHAARQVGYSSARKYRDTSVAGAKHQSHPVEVNYSSIRADKPEYFEVTPLMTGGYNESARLRLYTAYNFVNGVKGTVKAVNAVICSTCHGPLHSADSNPYTFDNMSAASFGNFSFNTADGYLLRRYNSKKSNNICTSCHKVQTHQTATMCSDCHVPHKGPGDNNIFLIRTSIYVVALGGKRSVQFISTTEMADRWRNQGAADGISNAICQVCHTATASHRNYSAAGVPRENSKMATPPNASEWHGGAKYTNCTNCHSHANGFPKSGGGCNGCHGASDASTAYPSDAAYGKHQKHIGTGSASYSWGSGTLADSRSAGAYGLSCGRCHSPFARYTDSQHNGVVTPSGNYTSDIGFKHKSILPNNTGASYLYGATGGTDIGRNAGSTWRYPGAGANDGLCRNLYCHGQFYNGYTGFNPNWQGTAPCGKCHGATQELGRGLPGNMKNSTNYGAHPRHVGGAAEQGYGQGAANFRCNACHALSATQNGISSVGLDRRYHVNGRINVKFDAAYGNGTYNGLNNYTAAISIKVTKPAYKTCGLIYCHSDGSRTLGNYSAPFNAGQGTGTEKFPNWSSSRNFTTTVAAIGGKARCARCHGAEKSPGVPYKGITAYMPGYTTRPNKGNSHKIHVVDNGFMCNVCHSGTTTTNKTIADTTLHVNKAYNVTIITRYNGGSAAYDSGTHTCTDVKCHGRQITPAWGNPAICQNCHLSSTGDVNKRILPRSKFTSWTSAVPKIYSTQWADKGHGRQSGSYIGYNTNNTFANKVCADCHGDGTARAGGLSTKHGTSNNPFRLYTAPDRPNILCERCHGTGGSATNSNGIFTHASSVTAAGHNYAVKCIDCHDPHGDNNIFMLHSTLPRPLNTSRDVASGSYGIITSNANQVYVDFSYNQYTSDYARKTAASKVCQVCHDETKNSSTSQSRFRYYSSLEKGHGSGRCTDCHQHSGGFKGAGCDGCHGAPPTGTFNLISGSGRINNTKKRASGNSTVFGPHSTHVTVIKATDANMSKYEACSACHYSGMWESGQESVDIELEFRAFTQYSGTNQEFNSGTGARGGFYGLSGIGVGAGTDNRCVNMKCHGGGGWLTASYGNVSTPIWGNSSKVKCGNCHGAKKAAGSGSWPISYAHAKHAGTGNSPMQYDFMCKLCHNTTVLGTATTLNKGGHVNGEANFQFYTGAGSGNRVYSQSNYTSADTKVNSGFGWCKNTYCHSRGTTFTAPYNVAGTSLSNYTAAWNRTATATTGAGKECSFCHGSKIYSGITSAMPNYNSGSPKINSHKKHVVDNGFSCYACHAATVNTDGRSISSKTNHVNKAYDVSFPSKYDAGSASYASSKCSNIKCHGGRLTPAWGQSSINCSECHYSNSTDVMDYTFRNYTDTASVPKIYSGEWKASGHGKSGANYNRTNNPPAGKICNTCHVSSVKHNTGSNFFRLTGLGGTSDPSTLCKRCHGKSIERDAAWMGNRTGIQGHTQQILSSSGYTNLTTWRFQPKCTDCHDPHGDAQAASGNIAMIRNTYLYNYSGSDSSGKPIRFGSLTTAIFDKYTGTKSFDNGDATKGRLCAACHKRAAHSGGPYTGHNNQGLDCRSCHKHKQGFNPSGCNGCHGDSAITIDRANWAPPKGPTGWSDSLTNMSSAHRPHAYNPRSRPGFGNQTGFACQYCHDDSVPSTVNHNQDKNLANLNNMTSTTGWNGMTKASNVNYGTGVKNPANDTCSNTKCHTPRVYTRTWQKPKDCDDCHGYTKGRGTSGLTGRQFNLQTTQSHKIHINWTGVATPPASWKKNYKFACSNCHHDPANNYSTHYSGQVNITSNGPVNTVGGQFYTRGRSFEGFTTGNESLGTCSKTYCHGNFANGTAITKPNWKKGVTIVNCGSCHRAKTAKVSGWADGSAMPAPHPKHVASTAGNYNFTCSRCHVWTVSNNTTVQFTYSTHVNTRKDVNFDNTSGGFGNSTKMCQNNYCHSSGATVTPRTVSNYTAEWDKTVLQKTGAGRECSYCHGSKGNGFGGITAAMPNYANQAHAKHARNATGDSFRCNVCHAATVNAAGQIISNINHVNKFKNISIIASYKSGQTAYSTTVGAKKTCKNIRCHGGLTTPLWTLSTGINCMDCHKSASGDTDKRISSNNTFQGYSESVPKIYTGQWLQRGHGRPTARGNYLVSSNSAANKTCTDCHGAGETRANGLLTRHGNTAANPFRLLTAPNRPNVLCESCHGTNATNPGKGTMVGIQTHASSVTGGGGNGFSYWMKCIDCHDPHGDNNVQMLHSTIARPSAALTKKESSNQFGALFFNATGRNVDFVNNVYTSDYAKKTTAPKVCQVCHSQTFKPNSSAQRTRFRWNGSSETAHGTGKCTSCHGHNQGFKGVKCDACHGNPPTSKFNMLTSTANGQKWPFSGTTSAGAHNRHVTLFGSDSNTCAFCHQQGMYNSGSSNDNIDIGFKAFGIYTGKYTGKAGVRSGWYGYSGVGITTGNTARCEVQCHGQRGWLTASYGTPTAPLWENNKRTASCGKCHGAKKAATSGSWPATAAHALHAGTGGTQLKYMCKLCHNNTVQGTATSLSSSYHVNSVANVAFGTDADPRADGSSAYIDSNSQVNSAVNGKCTNTYCHSKGTDTDKVAPYNNADDFANWTATWNDVRGSYRQATANTKAKCNYCHGNKNYTGILAASPRYNDGSPKSNKHPKHVETYRFLCTSCHVNVTVNNTSIDASGGLSRHVNRTSNVNFNTNTRSIDNSGGSYNLTGSRCETTYCHSKGTDRVEPVDTAADFAVYTAKWGDASVGYKTGANQRSRCNYCHGNRGAGVSYAGMTSAMPNYPTGAPKANAHNRHVAKYGFTCTECHMKVTTNNTSIDAAGGIGLHVNKQYNVYFKPAIGGRPQINNTGIYKYQSGAAGSSCKNTYCHSRGTDFVRPYSTRTSFSNFTAQWGDNVAGLGYKKPAGQKAKCNYCHGNRLFSGMTSAMPNYSTQIKKNSHKRHVVGYAFTCKACHKYVTNNNSSIDAAGGIGRHVNGSYNVDFSNSFNNNTGLYEFSGVNSLNKCKNMYCHSRGTDFTRPFNTRTSFANFTARWGEDLGSLGYKRVAGQKAKCNYCHGNRAYAGTTSAMPNYSGNVGAVKAKANSHRAHVIGNGYTCKECHYGVVQNNTSISDRVRHANAFYNISFAPGRRLQAGKMYSSVWGAGGVQGSLGGTCKNTTCHGTSTPKWGDPNTASCKACHLSATQPDVNSFGQPNDGKTAGIYSTEWAQKGHGKSSAGLSCANCHNSGVSHGDEAKNPFRLYTSNSDRGCLNCHGVSTDRNKWSGYVVQQYTGIATHSRAVMGGDAQWSFPDEGAKCVDCHDPHGDKNRKMIHAQINYTGSDRFGRPALPPTYGTVTSTAAIQMTFTAFNGQLNWSSFANNNVNRSICRRCHTPGVTGLGQNMNKTQYVPGHQSDHTQKCTACHSHKVGFKGGGVSSGGQPCEGCHNIKSLMMNNQNGYHHVLMNVSAAYRNVTLFNGTAGGLNDKARRCLMCHVDHDKFNGSKAKNLRESASDSGANGMNSDFWPAKRKNVVRTGADAGTANYSSTYPVKGATGTFGVCISCHKNVQYKNTTMQKDLDRTSRTRDFSVGLYTSSSHNFQVVSSFIRFDDSTKFRANCTKCHNTDQMDKGAQSGGRYQMALHEQNTPSLLNNGTSSSKPKIEDICYKCHSNDSRLSGGPGTTHDYYSSVKMSSGSKLLKTAITAKSSGHPIDDPDMAGLHKADEFFKLPNSYNYTRTGGVQGGPGSGWNRDSNRHVECTDCHNTHGGNASIVRQEGTAAGNLVAGAQKGAWGVKVKYPPFKTPGTAIIASDQAQPTYSTVRQSTYQFELCMKCHSAYSYYTAYPVTPSGTVARSTTAGDWDYSAPETDVGMDFHPNAHGYHPVVRTGRNQPPHSANKNWTGDVTNNGGKRQYIAADGSTKFQGVSGLGWTFVPPYSQKSTLACSDCHKADNTGNAIGKADAYSIVAQGGWTMPNGIADVSGYNDGKAATPIDSAVLNVYVKAASTQTNLQYGEAVIYGKSSSGTTNNRKVTVTAWKGGVQDTAIGAWAITFGKSNTRYTKMLGTPTAPTWADLTAGNVWDVRVNKVNTSEPSLMTVDYLGIAAIYRASGDIRGPHGSLQKWILVDLDRKVRFDADKNGTIGNVQWDALNSQWPTQRGSNNYAADSDILNMFCFNCHRRDVYEGTVGDTFVGTPAATIPRGRYSRIVHPLDGPAGDMANNNYGSNKIWCQNCHGGRVYEVTGATARADLTVRQNEIHGSFANMTVYNNSDGAFVAKVSRPKGVRLIHGAVIAGIDVPLSLTGPVGTYSQYQGSLTCYTISVADSMGACTSHNTGRTTTVNFNYSYTSW